MMPLKKKTLTLAILVVLLVSALAMAISVDLANANPILIINSVPKITLLSPQSILYYENSVNLSFYGTNMGWGTLEYSELKYWLDGEIKGTLNTALKAGEVFSVNLTGLKDGKHTMEVTGLVTVKSLTVYYGKITAQVGWGTASWTSSGQLNFTTDANAPNVSIPSWQDRTFETTDVPLNFTLSEPVSILSYSLDGNSNVTFTNVVMAHIYGKDNYYFVLNNLEEGSHSLKIYAKDTAGYTGESETYFFTVNTQPTPIPTVIPTLIPTPVITSSPSPNPTPTIEAALEPTQTASPTPIGEPTMVAYAPQIEVGTVVAVAVAAGALVYLRKRRLL